MGSTASLENSEKEKILVVVFTLGEEELAFEIQSVREIIRVPRITKVPNASEFVEGVINLRGQIKPVINLRRMLGLPVAEVSSEGKIIIIESHEQTFGVIVDRVVGVLSVETAEITDPSKLLGGDRTDFISGIGRLGERLVIMLTPEMLFSSKETLVQ
ncbi:MAG TPA: chemotaxis protein CheW [Euryarchaeota archaeon]|nr:chemotaxis protein CheW [archaeon BMS3Abin16]GBE56562.1 chemotaxis protein CheW [archaeon BMS3Bbin16]HDH28562.1 chemotaxis protein CheW [Euryarchaeota archaeon]HDY74620.1 chemotaxis protein CheW [Euryarchaeota archaeon]